MRYFLQVIRMSLRYKWSIVLSMVNALLIAFLWSMTISTVYPVVEVVFEGRTITSWVDDGIDRSAASVEKLNSEIDSLRQQSEEAPDSEKTAIAGQISFKEARRDAERKSHEWHTSVRPWVDRWAPKTPFGTLALTIAFLVIATLLKGVCVVLNVVLVARVASGTVMDLRRVCFRNAIELDQEKIDNLGTSRLMTLLSHNVNMVRAGLVGLYGKSVREPLKIIVCLTVAGFISWPLLLLSLTCTPLGLVVIHKLAMRMRKSASKEMTGYHVIFNTLIETFEGIKLIKVFTRERTERHRFKKNARSLYDMSLRMSFYDALAKPVSELMGIAVVAVAILCGTYLVLNQQTHLFGLRMSYRPLTASEMFTFFAMLASIADPLRKLTGNYNVVVRAAFGSQMLFSTFELNEKVSTNPTLPAPQFQKSIRFENVTFGYHPDSPVVKDLTLEIPYGQTVALVGINGCGKSTLGNLIAGFYYPQEGDIFLDDVNLRDMRPRQLRKQIGIVPQDPLLFQGTVWSNVRYADTSASECEVRRAIELAGVNEFARQLPRKLLTPVGSRGSQLSGGQRQRVALARALLSDPRILILDEATSQIDVVSEVHVSKSLAKFRRGRTVLLITHRPSLLRLADRVIVMDSGKIVKDVSGEEWAESSQGFGDFISPAA